MHYSQPPASMDFQMLNENSFQSVVGWIHGCKPQNTEDWQCIYWKKIYMYVTSEIVICVI